MKINRLAGNILGGFIGGLIIDPYTAEHEIVQDFVDTALFTVTYGGIRYFLNTSSDKDEPGKNAVVLSVGAGIGYLVGQLATHL